MIFSFIKRSENGLACIDFDNTLIYGDLGEELLVSLASDGLRNVQEDLSKFFQDSQAIQEAFYSKDTPKLAELVWDEYENKIRSEGMESAYRWSSFLFSGWKKDDFLKYTNFVWKRSIEQKRIAVYSALLKLIELLKENKWKIMVVTASPSWAIEAVIQNFNLTPQEILGMKLELKNGYTTSKIIEPYTYGEGKVKAIQNHFGKLPDLAIGDSINDLAMLSASKLSIVLDRGRYPEFISNCKAKGFLIQSIFT